MVEDVDEITEQSSDESTVQESLKGKMFLYVPSSVRKAKAFNYSKGDSIVMTVMSDGELRIRKNPAQASASVPKGEAQE